MAVRIEVIAEDGLQYTQYVVIPEAPVLESELHNFLCVHLVLPDGSINEVIACCAHLSIYGSGLTLILSLPATKQSGAQLGNVAPCNKPDQHSAGLYSAPASYA
eukprot:15588-Heterococcus_DN1.PRE.4